MERTASGHSISSSDSPPPEEPPSLLSDFAAAQLVHKHLSNVNRHARHARILRALVYPKTPSKSRDFTIDEDALESIFSAANDLFFANKLRGRVRWDWSHPDMASAGRYDCAIVGTTALRKRRGPKGGYETLIVLSSPILKDTKYNRRLLISTFLHEMIHSFLFVMCGRKAGINGGHTEGFRRIAADIDDWVGRECLRLTDMEADLDRFTVDEQCYLDDHADHSRGAVTFTELDGTLATMTTMPISIRTTIPKNRTNHKPTVVYITMRWKHLQDIPLPGAMATTLMDHIRNMVEKSGNGSGGRASGLLAAHTSVDECELRLYVYNNRKRIMFMELEFWNSGHGKKEH
ncbi:hypothetical protein NLU13_8212 [Sarocladium strictum]|uniref:SprT-like domain-containing protein n=1 Tax=Sarocladium strictum TaxID=5046 RepID=A0AA39L4R8_SARSR|nr:hypothetical protein NLU13_8212 [Sarocladium strictum]